MTGHITDDRCQPKLEFPGTKLWNIIVFTEFLQYKEPTSYKEWWHVYLITTLEPVQEFN